MKKHLFLMFALLGTAIPPLHADSLIRQIVVHCPDQDQRKANDPKPIYGDRVFGQTFIPARDKISFLRIAAARSGLSANPGLELRLWQCAENYRNTRAALPLAEIRTESPISRTGSLYFPMEAAVSPETPYYWELGAPAAPTDKMSHWKIWYQYGNNCYERGAFAVNGERNGSSDASFTTYYPATLTENARLSGFPEIVEVEFTAPMDPQAVKVSLTPAANGKSVSFWRDSRHLAVVSDPVKNAAGGAVTVQISPAGQTPENIRMNFQVIAPAGMSAAVLPEKSASSPVLTPMPLTEADSVRLLKGMVRIKVSEAKITGGKAEFQLEVRAEPVVGMQTPLKEINTETLSLFRANGVNAVTLALPAASDKAEVYSEVKEALALLHQYGFLVYWLMPLTPAGYDKAIAESAGDVHSIAWNGKKLKEFCYNPPQVRKAFAVHLEQYLRRLKADGQWLDGIILNEPCRRWGEFCYCRHCQQLFMEKYKTPMPKPLHMKAEQTAIPVEWPSGIPKSGYRKPEDETAWKQMSDFYSHPLTVRIEDIFRICRAAFPSVSCQVTTIDDIAPFYGLDFFGGILNLKELDGIQVAVYWAAVGARSPLAAGNESLAEKFLKKAHARKLSCYYWLQGYDAGDNSQPLKPGEIQVAIKAAFDRGVDGILIWSYLNPILGPWNKPYGWPEYLRDFKEGITPQLQRSSAMEKVILHSGEKQILTLKSNDNGRIVFRIETAWPGSGTATVSAFADGYHCGRTTVHFK